ncbi:mRNA capping enzyme [Nitzschia inconspicua]|uniref:mRNA capping enzyme n=1 Tax=Nitzschia inconspicua TaxID=303405 RepID=A0A9K3PCT6_9STRA|nr:mRNA capping enzyme [Nitzschia inconspicua]
MSKRPNADGVLGDLMSKKSKLDEKTASTTGGGAAGRGGNHLKNPFLAKPTQPEKLLQIFLTQVRNSARRYLPNGTKIPITEPFCEVEARLGILRVNNRRVTSSGPKQINGAVVHAFDGTMLPVEPSMVSGVSRSHFVSWTQGGLSEVSPLSAALGCIVKPNTPSKQAIAMIKRDLVETEYIETVFAGYKGDRRVSFPGLVDARNPVSNQPGQMEYKEKLQQRDIILPAAKYDLRIGLASEKVVDSNITSVPPGWTRHRVKRRRSYKRRDTNMAWQIDVTEVTTTPNDNFAKKTVAYEIEIELQASAMLKLVNEESQDKVATMTKSFAQQLWWIMQHLNPLEETVDVEELLQDHPNKHAVRLALATCGAMKKFMEHPPPASQPAHFQSPLADPNESPSHKLANMKFCGCMPVNFSRHNIEDVQQAPENGYFLSEKTDGVRHFMVFTGDTVVLVDRAMRGKQPIAISDKSSSGEDPMAPVLSLIQPGTVFDGEVVMHRGGSKHKARPVFIVFDVLTIGRTTAILHMPFEKRLEHLKQATFRTKTANRDMFADDAVADLNIVLPLVRKNFVPRTQIGKLLGHVVEEKGFRSYRNLPAHNHLTDGIIFQPNLPYVCGTDTNLLKWKYLDTVTIDVELLVEDYKRNRGPGGDDEDVLNTGVMGPDQTSVDMSRYVKLPASERFRLEADKHESGGRIAEVGFDPLSGEWYYLTMRPDKVAPNHISTVLGTLLELSESLTTEELEYRMSVPPGQRDTYRKEFKGMMKQLLEFQKSKQESMNR